jgi:hypothetical protein
LTNLETAEFTALPAADAVVVVVVVDNALKVNKLFAAFDCPPEVTTTLAVPAVLAGVVHVIDVGDTTTTLVHAAPPTVTVAPLAKLVPVIVIAVPPAADPDDGLTAVTVGSAGAAEYLRISAE